MSPLSRTADLAKAQPRDRSPTWASASHANHKFPSQLTNCQQMPVWYARPANIDRPGPGSMTAQSNFAKVSADLKRMEMLVAKDEISHHTMNASLPLKTAKQTYRPPSARDRQRLKPCCSSCRQAVGRTHCFLSSTLKHGRAPRMRPLSLKCIGPLQALAHGRT